MGEIVNVSNWYKDLSCDDTIVLLDEKITNMRLDFIAAGFYMKRVRDEEYFKTLGYETMWDFAEDRYGIQKSTASRWMAMNDKYSKEGNSPILQEEYKVFNKSQLQEMLYLTDTQLQEVTPDMTVKEIREVRKPEPKEEKPKYNRPNDTQREYLNSAAKHLIICHKDWFKEDYHNRVLNVDKSQEEIKNKLGYKTWHFATDTGTASCSPFPDCVQLRDEGKLIGDFEWFYFSAAIQSMWNVVALDELKAEQEKERQAELSREDEKNYIHIRDNCMFNENEPCTINGAKPVAQDIGIDCTSECCRSCDEDCGARCNHSVHERAVATSQQETKAEEDGCPPNQSSCTRQNWGSSKEDQEAGRKECKKCWESYKKMQKVLESDVIGDVKDEAWCVKEYVNRQDKRTLDKLMQICRENNNNADRARAIQKYIAPYGCHGFGSKSFCYDFHGFQGGIDFKADNDKFKLHMKYGRFVKELLEICDPFASEFCKEEKFSEQMTVKEHPKIVSESVEPNNESDNIIDVECEVIEEPEVLVESDLNIAKELLDKEQRMLRDFLREFDEDDIRCRKYKIKVAALEMYVEHLKKLR